MILLWLIPAVCDRLTEPRPLPPSFAHSKRLANCISYQLIVLLSSWPSGKPWPTAMRCLLLEESVFNHFSSPVLFCLQCINKCFKQPWSATDSGAKYLSYLSSSHSSPSPYISICGAFYIFSFYHILYLLQAMFLIHSPIILEAEELLTDEEKAIEMQITTPPKKCLLPDNSIGKLLERKRSHGSSASCC